jgi:hypothetical protein
VPRRELEDEAAAEAVTDPRDRPGGKALEQILQVLLERPRRLPARAAVAAQVGRDDVPPPGEPVAGEPLEPLPVRRDPVEADERRRRRIAPLVEVQLQLSASSPLPEGR